MKLIMENWRKYIKEGELIQGPWVSAKDQAVEEFIKLFPPAMAPDEVEAEEFIFALQSKEVESALKAIGYRPETFGMDHLGNIYIWVDRWFNKKSML